MHVDILLALQPPLCPRLSFPPPLSNTPHLYGTLVSPSFLIIMEKYLLDLWLSQTLQAGKDVRGVICFLSIPILNSDPAFPHRALRTSCPHHSRLRCSHRDTDLTLPWVSCFLSGIMRSKRNRHSETLHLASSQRQRARAHPTLWGSSTWGPALCLKTLVTEKNFECRHAWGFV